MVKVVVVSLSGDVVKEGVLPNGVKTRCVNLYSWVDRCILEDVGLCPGLWSPFYYQDEDFYYRLIYGTTIIPCNSYSYVYNYIGEDTDEIILNEIIY